MDGKIRRAIQWHLCGCSRWQIWYGAPAFVSYQNSVACRILPKKRMAPHREGILSAKVSDADWMTGFFTYTLRMDTRTPEQRRRIMQSVRSKDTGPELAIRRALFAAGYRYRLHRKNLPGTPDIVFPSRMKAIFVHGCFWHSHDCAKGRPSKSRIEYWGPKIDTNRARDERNTTAMEALGWRVLHVWQCELADLPTALKRVERFLNAPPNSIDKAEAPR